MKNFLCSLLAVALVPACSLPRKTDDQRKAELGPCDGANGAYEVRDDVICFRGRFLSRNAAEFAELGKGYAVDRKAGIVYLNGSEIKGADAATFEILRDIYSRDKERVYYRDRPISGADRATFKYVGYAFAKDKTHVYSFGSIAAEIDAASFNKVEAKVAQADWNIYEFFTDKNKVFLSNSDFSSNLYFGIPVDPATFVYYGGPFIQANGRVYKLYSEPLDVNTDTFRFLGCSFIRVKDPATHVFALAAPQREVQFCYYQDGERVIEMEY